MEFNLSKEYILNLNLRKICKLCSAKNTVCAKVCRVCKRSVLRYTKQKRVKSK